MFDILWTVLFYPQSLFRFQPELAKLGLQAATATIRKYRPRSRRPPSQSWRTFLQNHAGGIAAVDFFVAPTMTARLLYVLVVMNHARRKILHFIRACF